MLKLSVKDTGVGMTKEKMRRLFTIMKVNHINKFTQVNTGGIGIGLTACRILAQYLGGWVEVKSQPNLGTTISIVIDPAIPDENFELEESDSEFGSLEINESSFIQAPRVQSFNSIGRVESLSRIHSGKSPHASPKRRKEILIVDDNEFNVEIVGMMIQRHTPHFWEGVYSADAALHKMRDKQERQGNQYDIVFIDINMPEVDGVQLCKSLRILEREGTLKLKESRLICLTTLNKEKVGNIEEIGFDVYLKKPLKWKKLV